MNKQFAIVISVFYQQMAERLLDGALQRFLEAGVQATDVTIVSVPGAIEIPLVVQKLAKTRRYIAIVALGIVIQGETDHYEAVCQQVSQGCQSVMLATETPVIFGVLMTHNEQQAADRIGGHKGHKGRECVAVALTMTEVLQAIR